MQSFYSRSEVLNLGFKKIGSNVLISKKASFYSISQIEIGDNVRIDDFCMLSGKIKLGSYIHISTYCAIYGHNGVELEDFTGLSPRCTIFSASDDFSGEYLISPMVPDNLTNVTGGKVLLRRFVQIGAGTIILPGVEIGTGVSVGAMSLIRTNLPDWTICFGVPAKPHKSRSKKIIDLAKSIYEK